MGVRTASARAAWVVGATLLATTAAVAVPQAAAAETCAGDVTWTGTAANGDWGDDGNWSAGQVPGPTARAVLGAGAGPVTGLTGTVCGLSVVGGTAGSPTTLTGDLQVTGALELGGAVRYDGGDSGIVAGSLTTAPATDVTFLDGTADLQTTGGGVLGGTTTFHRSADPVGSAADLVVGGTLELAGDGITLQDVGLTLTGALDLKSRLVTVTGAATSQLADGAVVKDTVGGATAALDLATPLTTDGTVTVTSPARLRLSAGGALTAQTATTLAGTGSFLWRAGTVAGDVTLNLPSATDGEGTRALTGTASKLTIETGKTLSVGAPGLSVAGVVDNRGVLALGSGAKLLGTTGEAQLLNPGSGKVTVPTGTGTLDALPLIGTGTLAAGTGTGGSTARLLLTRSAWAVDSPALTTSQPQAGTTIRGGGFVQVGKGAAVALAGTVNVTEGSVLELDDDSDGTAARIQATAATLLGTGSGSTNGTVHWRSGQVRGQLTVDKLVTEVGNSGGDNGTPTGRQLHPLDGATRGKLTLLGPVVMQSARVVVQPRTDVVLSGVATFKLVGGFTAGNPAEPDATATMTPTATLNVAPSTVELFGTLPSAGVFDLPLLNQGTVTVSGGSSVAGSRIVNEGTVILSNASMTAPKGYVQQKRAGSTEDPVTGVLTSLPTTETPNPPPSTLSTVVAADKKDNVLISAGGLYGNGTVKAVKTTVAAGWVRPFVTETTPGKLRFEGDLTFGSGSDLQLLVGPVDATSPANPKPVLRDRVEVVALPGATGQPALAPGTATLGGRITGLTRPGYTPAYLTNVGSVLTAVTRVGTFASAAWSPSSTGLGWKPVYNGHAVELQYVDVAPPALGLAGIPAFTPLSTQRITYAAVDNKSGVKSYDVRYKRNNPTTLGVWTYPSSWQNRTATSLDQVGLATGWTYCYSVRARDKAGNTTNWSQPLCTTRMADDRAWIARGSWTRPSGVSGFYGTTFSRSTAAGSYLRLSGTHNRIAVSALRCPTCGVIDVYSGSTRLARVDLRSSSNVMRTWTSPVLTTRNATVLIRVVTSGRPVVIDAAALRRS